MEPLLYGIAFVGLIGMVVLRMRKAQLDELRSKPGPAFDPALEAKLVSIENGEKNGTEALARICLSRSTPDGQRARALRMLAERIEPAQLGSVLHSVSRACGRHTCAELFRHAAQFPDAAALESSALAVLRGSWYDDLRLAAIVALHSIGTHGSLAVLRQVERKRTVPVYIRKAAAHARSVIASRHPRSADLRGAISESKSDGAALSLTDER